MVLYGEVYEQVIRLVGLGNAGHSLRPILINEMFPSSIATIADYLSTVNMFTDA